MASCLPAVSTDYTFSRACQRSHVLAPNFHWLISPFAVILTSFLITTGFSSPQSSAKCLIVIRCIKPCAKTKKARVWACFLCFLSFHLLPKAPYIIFTLNQIKRVAGFFFQNTICRRQNVQTNQDFSAPCHFRTSQHVYSG